MDVVDAARRFPRQARGVLTVQKQRLAKLQTQIDELRAKLKQVL